VIDDSVSRARTSSETSLKSIGSANTLVARSVKAKDETMRRVQARGFIEDLRF
jgi:hypothetical protein